MGQIRITSTGEGPAFLDILGVLYAQNVQFLASVLCSSGGANAGPSAASGLHRYYLESAHWWQDVAPTYKCRLAGCAQLSSSGRYHHSGCWFRLHWKLYPPSEGRSARPVDLHPKFCAEPIACARGAHRAQQHSQHGEDCHAERQSCVESAARSQPLSSRWPGSHHRLQSRLSATQQSSGELLHLFSLWTAGWGIGTPNPATGLDHLRPRLHARL